MADQGETKPRQPIAAMYNSPGPVYALPPLTGSQQHDPRSTHRKLPSFSLGGISRGVMAKDVSPGPVHFLEPNVTKVGKDGTPHYSLYAKAKDIKPNYVKNPGPGAYQPENSGPSAFPQSPRYSLAARCRQRHLDHVPAPNRYSLPTSIGKTIESSKSQRPSWSLRSRPNVGSFSEDLSKTPGPGAHDATVPDLVRKKAPSYTVRSRVLLPGDNTTKPGPGAHSPERVRVNKNAAPSFSFGKRHSQFICPLIIDVAE